MGFNLFVICHDMITSDITDCALYLLAGGSYSQATFLLDFVIMRLMRVPYFVTVTVIKKNRIKM